jgi:hypothetical protein
LAGNLHDTKRDATMSKYGDDTLHRVILIFEPT